MSEQVQRRRVVVEEQVAAEASSSPQLLDIDAILDEIDEVLHTDAEDYVRGFVQKGGQ